MSRHRAVRKPPLAVAERVTECFASSTREVSERLTLHAPGWPPARYGQARGGCRTLLRFVIHRRVFKIARQRNRDVRTQLFGTVRTPDRRQSAQVSRLVKRLHLRGFVAKIPRSRRWRVTQLGHAVMSTAIRLREDDFPNAFVKTAA